MIHGHAKIELTNVKTGEKKVIEHDNMLTNYWRDMFTPRGVCGKNLQHCQLDWNKQKFFGGILLFENQLDSDADNYKFPKNNKMVARGSDFAYSGVDTTMGSFNASESSITADSATLVWDWTQERGNGTISALGLTSAEGGLIGAGNDGVTDKADAMVIQPNVHQIREMQNIGTSQEIQFIDTTNNVCYAAAYSNPNLLVRKWQFVETGMDLLTFKMIAQNSPVVQDHTVYTDSSISLSSFGFGGTQPCATMYQGKLYMTAGNTNWGSGSRTFARYDFATGTLDSVSITNNTGKTLVIQNYALYRMSKYTIYNGYMYFMTTDNKIVYINLADNTDCGIVKDGNGDDIARANTSDWDVFIHAWGDLFFSKAQTALGSKGNENDKQMYCLESKGIARRRNLAPFYRAGYDLYVNTESDVVSSAFCWSGWTSGYLYRDYNLMCLATKNNLDAAVTKTADMTMRVTYTIREVSE